MTYFWITLLVIVLFFALGMFPVDPIKHSKQDKRREAYQKMVKAKREAMKKDSEQEEE